MKQVTYAKIIGLSTVLSFSLAAVAADQGTAGYKEGDETQIEKITPTPGGDTVQDHLQSKGKPPMESAATFEGLNEAQIARFEELDQNSDGLLSQSEIESDSNLSRNWETVDSDYNGRIDRVEFSAFEVARQDMKVEEYSTTPDEGETVQEHLQTEERVTGTDRAGAYGGKEGEPIENITTTPGGDTVQDHLQAADQPAVVRFEDLDQNNDSLVTPSETERDSALSENWESVDKNNDGAIDRVEFSAFEMMQNKPME